MERISDKIQLRRETLGKQTEWRLANAEFSIDSENPHSACSVSRHLEVAHCRRRIRIDFSTNHSWNGTAKPLISGLCCKNIKLSKKRKFPSLVPHQSTFGTAEI